MSLSTIDLTLTSDLFAEIDPTGLQQQGSARAFQIELRKRLKAEFPKANIFLKWNPNRKGEADVFTLPEGEESRKRVLEIAGSLLAERDRWVQRDGGTSAGR